MLEIETPAGGGGEEEAVEPEITIRNLH